MPAAVGMGWLGKTRRRDAVKWGVSFPSFCWSVCVCGLINIYSRHRSINVRVSPSLSSLSILPATSPSAWVFACRCLEHMPNCFPPHLRCSLSLSLCSHNLCSLQELIPAHRDRERERLRHICSTLPHSMWSKRLCPATVVDFGFGFSTDLAQSSFVLHVDIYTCLPPSPLPPLCVCVCFVINLTWLALFFDDEAQTDSAPAVGAEQHHQLRQLRLRLLLWLTNMVIINVGQN